MSRRRYLVAYDVADPVRLRHVHQTMKGYGYALQYSVFICDMSATEKLGLKSELGEIINYGEDRIVMVDLDE